MSSSPVDSSRLVRDAIAQATELSVSGRWSNAMQVELDQGFERAARKALRAAALYERSVMLRRIARRVIPTGLRPIAKRAARLLDRLMARGSSRKSGPQRR